MGSARGPLGFDVHLHWSVMTHRCPPTQQKEPRVGTDDPGEEQEWARVSAGRGSLSLALCSPDHPSRLNPCGSYGTHPECLPPTSPY